MNISKFIEWTEKYRIIRKLTLLWAVWLITWTVTTSFSLTDINGAVATIVTAVVGILSVAVKFLVHGDKEGE